MAVVLWVPSLHAEDAGALFDRGVDAMEAGKYTEACPMLAESWRLDPRPGTLFTLAECEARQGKLASAAARYDEYIRKSNELPAAQRSKHTERQQKAAEALTKLDPRIARVTFVGLPAGAEAALDGRRLDPAQLTAPFPVEAGEHRVVVRHDGAERSVPFSAAAGGAQQVNLEPPSAAPAASSAAPVAPAPSAPRPARSLGPVPFYAAAGAGLAGLVVGTIGGVIAFSKKSDADKQCPGQICTPAGLDAVDTGRTAATASTIGFVVGGVFLGAAGALWATRYSAPGSSSAALRLMPAVSHRDAGLSLGGAW